MSGSIREFSGIRGNAAKAREVGQAVAKEGAVIVRGLATKEETDALRDGLINAVREDEARHGLDYIFHGMVHALMTRGQAFRDLIGRDDVQGIMKGILGDTCIVHAYVSSSMPPAQVNKGTNYSRSIHVDCPRLIPGYPTNVGLTLALHPFRPETGGMEIIPNSFERADAPSEEEFRAQAVSLELDVGDCVVFNARCWHRGGLNKTPDWRHAVTMNICRAYMRQQFDYPRMLEKLGLDKDLSPALRQFLGYDVRVPTSMEDFLLPTEQRLYKPNQG